ncbi:MAG: transferrin-binding protein-like solute binding protein [Gammaproteobacteria bacterium]|nr:transferrin-binding protein-like solute binding protein [Gammaproteobacteria bacterium]
MKLMTLLLLCLAFAGCNSAGGTRPEPAPDPEPEPMAVSYPDIEWAVDAEETRTNVGGNVLDLSAGEVDESFIALIDEADSIYLSNVGVLVDGGDDEFNAPDCAGRVCEAPGLGDINLDEIDTSNYESQPVMVYRGISFGQRRSPGTDADGESFEALGYGGWLDHHYFAINASLYPDTDNAEKVVLYSYVVGDETGTNPTSGSASWKGVAIGVDASQRFHERRLLQADVDITIEDFMSPMVDILFDNIKDLRTGEDFTLVPSVSWSDLALVDGAFAHEEGTLGQMDRNRIEGRFYGPDQEEIGGVFEYATVVGSFGARRD